MNELKSNELELNEFKLRTNQSLQLLVWIRMAAAIQSLRGWYSSQPAYSLQFWMKSASICIEMWPH